MNLREHVEQVVWPARGLRGAIERAALRPLSSAFGFAVAVRNLAYDVGVLRTQRAAVPVVSVGNLAVGGTGKTPMTLWLSRELKARGLRVAIVLRGYGGARTAVTVVSRGNGPQVSAAQVGDEAVMLAKCFDGFVVTSAQRFAGATAAIALGADVIVLDDGFQHRALARDFDLVLVDACRGPLLPAGPLREGTSALRRADAAIVIDDAETDDLPSMLSSVPVHRMRVEPTALVESVGGRWVERPLGGLVGKRVVAVAGIARPERFYQTVQQWAAIIAEVFEFRDHHQYASSEWQAIARRGHEADLIVTTEKDLVKLEAFPFARGKLLALRLGVDVEDGDGLVTQVIGDAAPVAP
jgi:tetraacyldisaccharide 4'-kinase